MQENGLATSEEFINRLEDNANSLEAIDSMLDEKIKSTANMIRLSQDSINNQFLTRVVSAADVDEASFYNLEGEIIYSSFPDYIGWSPEVGHPVYDFMNSSDTLLIEEIRQDIISGNYVKFGYIKGDNGQIIQVAVSADRVQELTDAFSYQRLIDDVASNDWIEYATVIDENLISVAHNNRDIIGTIYDDEGSKTAAIDGIPYTQPWFYEPSKTTVYDVCYPLIINGEHMGAVSIGYSMSNIDAAIKKNIIVAVISAIISFIILGIVLYRSSNDAVKVIDRLKEQMGFMASGDFSQAIPQDLLDKTDEFGEISRAVGTMQESVKDVISNVFRAAEQLAASSEELTATSQQSATAADEVSRVIEDIASGATDQAKETEQGALSITDLGDLVMKNQDDIQDLNTTTEKVNSLKDEGLEILRDLVEKTHINSKSSKEVQGIIINTNESAERIVGASEMIQSIADQTNLLALNAAIEAARAGDAGRGFAVVANEIRVLAEQSNQFTSEINTIIKDLTDKTSSGVKTMAELEEIVSSQSRSVEMTNNKFDGIAEAIEEMQQLIKEVSISSDEMAHRKEGIVSMIEQLSAISEENVAGTQEASASVEEQTASMEEIANSSEELAKIAEELSIRVSQFKI